jgi:uncharacterized protein (DUF4415 family)
MKISNHKTPLKKSQLKQLAALNGGPDIADIPESPPENRASTKRGQFFKPRKAPVSLRLDMEVVDWLKRKGPGYQTEINAIRRRQMKSELSK